MSEQGVTVEIREQIDLGGSRRMASFGMRIRHVATRPGGRLPMRRRGDRPSILYFVSGEVTERNALGATPIARKAGEASAGFGADLVSGEP